MTLSIQSMVFIFFYFIYFISLFIIYLFIYLLFCMPSIKLKGMLCSTLLFVAYLTILYAFSLSRSNSPRFSARVGVRRTSGDHCEAP